MENVPGFSLRGSCVARGLPGTAPAGEQVHRYLGTGNIYTMYDETGHWLGDYDSTGAPIQQAIWLDDLPVGVIAAGNLHYIEADHLGTPRVVIDPQRDVAVWQWELIGEAFGDSVPNQDPDGDASAFVFNMRFPGQRYDAASGLNYNYFRDYEAGIGRYVESDLIGLKGGLSTYGYGNSAPLKTTYRRGLFGFDASCSAAQRIFITSQIVLLANDLNERIRQQQSRCFNRDCDLKLVEDAMNFISYDAWYTCDGDGCGGQAARYQIFAPGYMTSPPNPATLADPDKGCGCFRSALFHEGAHAVRQHYSENDIRRATRSCVNCAANVDERGIPLW